jgi:glycosyltransferase involved in cell wall biosynthesis
MAHDRGRDAALRRKRARPGTGVTPLRIVFVVAAADLSGGIRVIATYARLLSDLGHEVTVVSTPPPPTPWTARIRALVTSGAWPRGPRSAPSHLDEGVHHYRLDCFRPVTDRDLPDADVVIATWWLTAEWVAALSPRKGAKVHFVQGDDAAVPGQPVDRIATTWKLPLHRIVCSRWLLELANTRYGDRAASYVPNGVDLDRFTGPVRSKQDHPAVGFVYSETYNKGCDVALAAFHIAARRIPGLRLISFASAPVGRSLPLPPRAEFALRPRQSDIPALYASCDAWLWPSRREGFGLPILEAMACGTPVIAAPAGAAPELLAEGGGVLLPGAEPFAMAREIENMVAMPADVWMRMSTEAREVASRHGWASSVRAFEAVLQRLT